MIKEWPSGLYVLVPSYKSGDKLKRFIGALSEVAPKEYICVVDDASADETYEYCVDFGITCLCHDVNKGKGAALKTGFGYLTQKSAKWILTMDADGQHSPTDIPRFIKAAQNNPTIGLCIGARDMRFGVMPPFRILSNRLTSAIISVLVWQPILDSQCGYRLYSKKLIESICLDYDRFEMESEVIIKAAAKKISICFVRVQTLYLDSSSHISHLIDTLRWIKAVLSVWCKLKFGKSRPFKNNE